MNKRKRMRAHIRQMIQAGRDMLDYPYKLGGWGGDNNNPPNGIDCRGLVQMAFKDAGARDLIGGYQPNVRAMVKWARDNGRFTTTGQRGDVVFYNEPAKAPEPANPEAIRHTGIVIRPISVKEPLGWAMSALNPRLDCMEHPLELGHGLAILGFCHPDWASLDAEPPQVDPEPPIE